MAEAPSLLPAVSSGNPVVLVVEDDPSIRDALCRLFATVGRQVQTFQSATELLESEFPDEASCLVLDIRLPGRSGLNLQAELAKAGVRIPIIFMTGHGDIPMSVQAMKAGASDFLTKPFRDQDMLDAVASAIEHDRARRADVKVREELQTRFASLSQRERDVMALATNGLMNKQIAFELGLSEVTVKIHRGNMMKKMKARSLVELVRMFDHLKNDDAKAATKHT
ncbi:MAG TPA: response regulator transcription factor [Rhizobiaceae bacterium]